MVKMIINEWNEINQGPKAAGKKKPSPYKKRKTIYHEGSGLPLDNERRSSPIPRQMSTDGSVDYVDAKNSTSMALRGTLAGARS